MFHAISACLARPARRIASRLATSGDYATWHGWQACKVTWGTWRYRDPRFDQFAARQATAGRRS